MQTNSQDRHQPVLLDEVIAVLKPQKGETYLDLTAGFGGHATKVMEAIGTTGVVWLIDQDQEAINALTDRFGSRAHTLHANFSTVNWEQLPPADMILMDIGVSSWQLDAAHRGFSFQHDGPLDMRMDQSTGQSAADLVNQLEVSALADIIWRYGEDRASRRLAAAIVAARPLTTTGQLRDVIHGAIGSGGRIDSATRTFQALRIAVNDELRAVETTLPRAAEHLKPGGRLAVITFHSLEDRIVKQAFKTITTTEVDPITGQPLHDPQFALVTKKPLRPAATEIDSNPRARSAKLRAVEKQK